MKVQKGDLLNIQHSRKGLFKAVATRDFDTGEEWYPIVVAPDQYVGDASGSIWASGAGIPCRASLVRMILVEEVLKRGSADDELG